MRIRQLDLLRYGHFTDAIIALPPCMPDFQMLLGENEAGKSTAMNGVEDLLFGIPALRHIAGDHQKPARGAFGIADRSDQDVPPFRLPAGGGKRAHKTAHSIQRGTVHSGTRRHLVLSLPETEP